MTETAAIEHTPTRVIDGSGRSSLGHFDVRFGRGACDRFTYSVDEGSPEMTMAEAHAAAMDWITEKMGMME